ncbi:helix-turn-helix transcriptional regulator [Granulicella sibirica]|uniref:Transcriptional regulator, AraC family n=1 Tax=Granulicella sibirica TaxID=2479048 RepID=A0A4Q0T1Y7_9BACT|nr:helix-turn-helix domain-containing protein [Granulicella sibirica]RXH55466.1 Transcriptional regulator, AraC family [Granulicella sibirica]
MLNVQSASPESALRPFIRAYVQREARLGVQELVEPVVARLGVMLEFEFAGSYEVRNYGSETLEDPNEISVIGPQGWRRSRLIIRGHIESLVIMFQPCGFHALFGVPTAPLSNAGTEGHSLLGPSVSQLHERLGNLRTFSERVNALDAYFSRQVARVNFADPVYRALHLLTVTGSGLKVADVARQMGVNVRQLERRSLAYAGVSPKALSRISRFSHALRLRAERSMSWTQIAHAAQYHDHMHMIRDFRELAGEAPTSAIQEIAPEHLIHFARNRLFDGN